MAETDAILTSAHVAVSSGHHGYPSERPYSPEVLYPEYPFSRVTLAKEANPAYDGVRDALRLLGTRRRALGPIGRGIRWER